MLSRVADSIYWMTRYIERAENIARFINVNLNLSLDMAPEISSAWQPLVMTTGDHEIFEKRYGTDYSRENVIQFLALDREYGNSIISCVAAARENARSVREIISSAMWEQINRSYLLLKDATKNGAANKDPHHFFKNITALGHMFTGLLQCTISRGRPSILPCSVNFWNGRIRPHGYWMLNTLCCCPPLKTSTPPTM